MDRNRLIAMAIAVAGPASAQTMPPAEPPWACNQGTGCFDGDCEPPTEPRSVVLELGPVPGTLAVERAVVPFYATRAEAEAALASDALPAALGYVSYVFVRDAFDPADAIGISMIWIDRRGAVPKLADAYVSFICGAP